MKDLNLTKATETMRTSQAIKDMASHIADEPTASSTVNTRHLRIKRIENRPKIKNREAISREMLEISHHHLRYANTVAENMSLRPSSCKKCRKNQSTKAVHTLEEELSEEETYICYQHS